MAKHSTITRKSRKADLTPLLTRARAQGWAVKVVDFCTVCCSHPAAGEITVSAAMPHSASRKRLVQAMDRLGG